MANATFREEPQLPMNLALGWFWKVLALLIGVALLAYGYFAVAGYYARPLTEFDPQHEPILWFALAALLCGALCAKNERHPVPAVCRFGGWGLLCAGGWLVVWCLGVGAKVYPPYVPALVIVSLILAAALLPGGSWRWPRLGPAGRAGVVTGSLFVLGFEIFHEFTLPAWSPVSLIASLYLFLLGLFSLLLYFDIPGRFRWIKWVMLVPFLLAVYWVLAVLTEPPIELESGHYQIFGIGLLLLLGTWLRLRRATRPEVKSMVVDASALVVVVICAAIGFDQWTKKVERDLDREWQLFVAETNLSPSQPREANQTFDEMKALLSPLGFTIWEREGYEGLGDSVEVPGGFDIPSFRESAGEITLEDFPPEAAEYLREHRGTLRRLYELWQEEEPPRWRADSSGPFESHQSAAILTFRSMFMMIMNDARLLILEGDTEGAVQALGAGLGIATAMREEENLSSILMAVAFDGALLQELGWVNPVEVASLLEESNFESYFRALAMEFSARDQFYESALKATPSLMLPAKGLLRMHWSRSRSADLEYLQRTWGEIHGDWERDTSRDINEDLGPLPEWIQSHVEAAERGWMRVLWMELQREQLLCLARLQMMENGLVGEVHDLGESRAAPGSRWEAWRVEDGMLFLRLTEAPPWTEEDALFSGESPLLLPLDGSQGWSPLKQGWPQASRVAVE